MNTNPQPEIIAYAAKTILTNLVDLQKSIKGVNRRRNVEDIHDLRVSSRRIREALDIFMPFLPAKKSFLKGNQLGEHKGDLYFILLGKLPPANNPHLPV